MERFMSGAAESEFIGLARRFLADASLDVDILDQPATDDPSYISFWLSSSTKALTGVLIPRESPGSPQRVTLGDQVQEFIHEELAVLGRPAVWPECPAHPGSHPLIAVLSDGDAVWACPRTHEALLMI
jgi:hypothetical protein